MNNKTKTLILSISIVLILCLLIFGGTFAYFSARTNSNGDSIGGDTYEFDIDLTLNPIKNLSLVPVVDNLIASSLTSENVCEDVRGYGLCSIYQITLTNSGMEQVLTGDIKTNQETTYTADHVKYQLYTYDNNVYTEASDVGTLSHVANSKSSLLDDSEDLTITVPENTTKNYYLVIWLSDIGANQLEDVSKKYSGTVEFISISGEELSVSFTTSS